MAEPSMPLDGADNDHGDNNDGAGQAGEGASKKGKKGGKYSFSKVCPHKAFPTKQIDRKQFKNQKEYVNFLMQKPIEDHPWYNYATPKRPFTPKSKSAPATQSSPKLQNVKRLPLTAGPPEVLPPPEELDLDKYIVLEKEEIKKKRKKKKKKISTMDFEIKVNKELEFLLGVMAEAKEVLVQKAIDFEREREENERKGKEEYDITVLRTIVQGMMFKVMEEHEEDMRRKEQEEKEEKERELEKNKCPQKKECSKKDNKKKKKSKKCKPCTGIDEFDDAEAEKHTCSEKQKMKEQTTKQLIMFLKELYENQLAKAAKVTEEKAISPYVSEEELQTIVYTHVAEEFLEEEGEEEEYVELEEEESPVINKDAEGYVDMNEVKKRLEDLQTEEGVEGEGEYEAEEDEFLEGQFDDWLSEEESEYPLMQDASAQFNYFLERKKVVGKTPKNLTDDLAQFMRIVIMGDNNLREIMEEKELIEFKRKQLDFMTMGMLLKKPRPCQCIKTKKGVKGKCKCKCCTKGAKGRKGHHAECGEDKDLTYNIRPIEFMLMLQVLMNTLELIYEQEQLLKQPSVEPVEIVAEASEVYVPEYVVEEKEEEEEEEDDNGNDSD